MKHMQVWLGMIVGQVICVAIGLTDWSGAATASYWCGLAIFACWLQQRPSRSARASNEP